ncbi:NAD kinase [Altericroceibacterium spongiae]|uniref:NAD kinase n=1 Tax=Altericroceibacterium spongiae TaxID=2320269 RepID=A0A420ESA8_9SPHN|nr:NAD kinase [Altericroceibacterium spongiae]RKF23562.1 NAD kinase [Altericroceibacterium spongiae]
MTSGETNHYRKLALRASPSERAQQAAEELTDRADWVSMEEADAVVVLGGDGFMLHILHQMLHENRVIPAYGLNLGTVGFLMNRYHSSRSPVQKISRARSIAVAPLLMTAVTQSGEEHQFFAINEVSLLRETRQTAKIEVLVNGKPRIAELACDGVLLATPAGSTAYNLSANGPILPLDSKMLALTPISPFRPRRWRGAILPDRSKVSFRIREPEKRPVAAVADQREIRDIAEVHLEICRDRALTLLFDPGHSLDERIVTEQFIV